MNSGWSWNFFLGKDVSSLLDSFCSQGWNAFEKDGRVALHEKKQKVK